MGTRGTRTSTVLTSTSYYDTNADAFFAQTVDADMGELHRRFLAHVPPGGCILDAGCGSGRDTRAFLTQGFRVVAFDASLEMVKLASDHCGLVVRWMRFDDMAWEAKFDGIWASASLLHVPASELPVTFARFRTAMKPGAALYASFKYGEGERDKDGRPFTDMTERTLTDLVATVEGLRVNEIWQSQDVRPGRSFETWLNAIIVRSDQE